MALYRYKIMRYGEVVAKAMTIEKIMSKWKKLTDLGAYALLADDEVISTKLIKNVKVTVREKGE